MSSDKSDEDARDQGIETPESAKAGTVARDTHEEGEDEERDED